MDNEITSTTVPVRASYVQETSNMNSIFSRTAATDLPSRSSVPDMNQYRHATIVRQDLEDQSEVSQKGAVPKARHSSCNLRQVQRQPDMNDMEMLALKTLPIHSGVAFNVGQHQICKPRKYETNESGRSFEKLRALLRSQDPYFNPRTRNEKIPHVPENKTGQGNVYKWSVSKNRTKFHQTPCVNNTDSKVTPLQTDNNLQKSLEPVQENSAVSVMQSSLINNTDKGLPAFAQVTGPELQDTCFSNFIPIQNDMRRKRFLRTKEVLAKSGLLDVTMKTASLLGKNKSLQTEIEQLKQQVSELLKNVSHNPENNMRNSDSTGGHNQDTS